MQLTVPDRTVSALSLICACVHAFVSSACRTLFGAWCWTIHYFIFLLDSLTADHTRRWPLVLHCTMLYAPLKFAKANRHKNVSPTPQTHRGLLWRVRAILRRPFLHTSVGARERTYIASGGPRQVRRPSYTLLLLWSLISIAVTKESRL